MKKKITALFLSTFIFVSSCVTSFANPIVAYAPQIVGTVATVFAAAGIPFNKNEDIYNNVYDFFNTVDYDVLKTAFIGSVTYDHVKGQIQVGSSLLEIIQNYLESKKADSIPSHFVGYYGSLPVYNQRGFYVGYPAYQLKNSNYITDKEYLLAPGLSIKYTDYSSSARYLWVCVNGVWKNTNKRFYNSDTDYLFILYNSANSFFDLWRSGDDLARCNIDISNSISSDLGSFDWGKIKENIKDGSLSVNVPKDVSDLVGVKPSDVMSSNPPYELPKDGILTFPNVQNPSISLGDSLPFPGVEDVPSDVPIDTPVDTPFDAIRDFVISLVVPADTYWIDKFNHFKDMLLSKFPGIDVTELNKVIVGEVPFPNIDVSIMGVKVSRILDSDSTINKTVTFFRPLIQGFVSIFLFLFIYRQIYFLIRGTSPFSAGTDKGGSIK